jgi:molybdenum cofactor synthesis domain-containing protein
VTAAVLTISDASFMGMRRDLSGPAVKEALEAAGWQVTKTAVLPDEREMIAARLRELADSEAANAIFTTGGTGAALRDVTPEATLDAVDRAMPGLGELMRAEGRKHTPLSYLSRGTAGLRGKTLIVNLPGSPKGAVESLTTVLPLVPHIVDLLHGRTGH